MKYLFIFLIVSTLSFISFGQNKYLPFIGKNKYWIYSQQDESEPPNTIGGFLFSFGSDTIVNGISYSKLIKYGLDGESSCPDKPCFTPYIPYRINTNIQESFAYLREDTLSKKVYCLPAIDFDKFCDTTEHVLYDFNQAVGDTLSKCNLLIHSGWPISDRYFRIDSINTEFIYNKMRQVCYFDGFFYGGLPGIRTMKQVEGVGIEYNLGFYVDYTVTFVDYCEGTLADCNIISSTKDFATNTNHLKIYPNPSNRLLHIDGLNAEASISIQHLNGQIIKTVTTIDSQVDIIDLTSGIYIFKIQNKDVNERHKVVKME